MAGNFKINPCLASYIFQQARHLRGLGPAPPPPKKMKKGKKKEKKEK